MPQRPGVRTAQLRALEGGQDMVALFVVALTDAVVQAAAEATRVSSGQVAAMVEAFRRRLGDRGQLMAVHHDIGRAAQREVLDAYRRTVTARERPASRTHYRAGATPGSSDRRFAGGVLARALARRDFFEASWDGLRFINETMLDREAAHWRRLAFGAGPAGEGIDEHFDVRWGNLVVAALGISEEPRPAFRIPRGVWVNAEGRRVRAGANPAGTDMFYPQSERAALRGQGVLGRPSPSRVTRGIETHNFIGPGVAAIAREFPRAYAQLYEQWWAAAQRGAGPLTRVVRVRPPRPYTLRRGVSRF